MTKNRQHPRPYRQTPKERDEQRSRCGDRIRKLRNDNGMSLKAFAEAIKYGSHSNISLWEGGNHLPSGDALTAFHKRFGVSPAWILGLSDVQRDPEPVTLPGGAVISDDQLEAALRIKAERAIRERMQAGDRTAKFMRHVVELNGIDGLMAPGPSFDEAVRSLVTLAERVAKLSWRFGVAARVGRLLTKRLSEKDAATGQLASRLTSAELSFGSEHAFDETQLKTARKRAWDIYRRDSKNLP